MVRGKERAVKQRIILVLFCVISISVCAGGSREYQPSSRLENEYYQRIDKSIWPDDARANIEKYKDTNTGWAGVVQRYMTDFTNPEYNLIGFYVKHHYYDWIENMRSPKPINLSRNGEGYFVCNYVFRKEIDPQEIVKDFVGDVVINYGSPVAVADDGTIILTTDYIRIIDKNHVNPNWIDYGRGGLEERIIK